jgi:trans-2,3-dihydro-3-hydroxyanthranilate isomerase
VELVAACASLAQEDAVITTHPPRIVSVGLPSVVAELASKAALAQVRPNLTRLAEADAAVPLLDGGFALFLYVPRPGAPQQFSAHMFGPLDNVLEDPATGSASAALAAYRVALMAEEDAEVTLEVEQGVEMGRPSQIRLQVHKVGALSSRWSSVVTAWRSCEVSSASDESFGYTLGSANYGSCASRVTRYRDHT